jgi:WD40 repeat protein
VTTFHGNSGWVLSCACSPDGRLLATGDVNGVAKLWDAVGRKAITTLCSDAGAVNKCMFSPHGRLLATAHGDGRVRLWDVTSGHEVASMQGHTSRVMDCSFSADGRLIATASADGTVRVWMVTSREETRATFVGGQFTTMTWHTTPHGILRVGSDPVIGCALSPDARLVATTSLVRTVTLWDVESGKTLAHAYLLGDVTAVAGHPSKPLLGVGEWSGRTHLLQIVDNRERAKVGVT